MTADANTPRTMELYKETLYKGRERGRERERTEILANTHGGREVFLANDLNQQGMFILAPHTS